MATIGALQVDLQMATAKFTKATEDVNKRLGGIEKQAKMVGGAMKVMMGLAAGAGFAGAIKKSLDYQNSLYDLSVRLGVTTEGLSRLHHAAELSGVSMETMNMGLQRMTRRVAEAATGSGEAVKALDEMGISAAKLKELSPDQQFHVLADALKTVEEPADRVRLAMKLFDSEGVKLIQTMSDGSEGLREMGEASDEAGRTITEEAARAAMEANAAFTQMGAAGTGLANTLAVQLGPTLASIAEWTAKVLPEAIKYTALAFKAAAHTVTIFAHDLIQLARVFTYYGRAIPGVGDKLGEFDDKLFSITENLKGAGEAILDSMVKSAEGTRQFAVDTKDATFALEKFNLEAGKTNAVKKTGKAGKEKEKELNDNMSKLEQLEIFLMSEEEKIRLSYQRRQEIVDTALSNEQLTKEKYAALSGELEAKKNAEIEELALAQKEQQLAAAGDLFGSMAGLLEASGKKQSGLYKAMFAASKAFALAESIVKIQQGIASAASLPFPSNIPAMATVAAQTASIVTTIKGADMAGAAHGGLTNVPNESTYLLQKGERVLSPNQNKDLNNFMANGGGSTVNVYNYSGQPVQQTQRGNEVDIVVGKIRQDIRRGVGIANDFQQTYGLTRAGVV